MATNEEARQGPLVGLRVLEFAGIATIRDEEGRHQDVRIVFPQAATPADARALQGALATPLVRQCRG